jgi:hypothetical protein
LISSSEVGSSSMIDFNRLSSMNITIVWSRLLLSFPLPPSSSSHSWLLPHSHLLFSRPSFFLYFALAIALFLAPSFSFDFYTSSLLAHSLLSLWDVINDDN